MMHSDTFLLCHLLSISSDPPYWFHNLLIVYNLLLLAMEDRILFPELFMVPVC